jgi:hypothetical protein
LFPRANSTCINLENRAHLATLLALTDLDAELGLRSHDIVPSALQDANVQECITRAIPQLNEAEALLCIEPFYSGVDRRAARGRILAGCPSKCLARRLVAPVTRAERIVVVKLAPP